MSLNVICFSLPYVYPFIHFLTAEQDVDCRLLPTGKDISADFHLKASGKGVKMVYLNLKIGNDSYHPLEKVDEFLPERWVWAKSIEEHMLSLPENYDVLSLGLLKYQVTSLDVHLEDKPTGCVASLNSSSQNMAIGKMLLEYVTVEKKNSSDSQLQVVCVEMIKTIEGDYGRYLEQQCCGIWHNNLESRQVLCNQTVGRSDWEKPLDFTLFLVCFFLSLFIPAFPLALPDYIFSLQRECDKAKDTEDTGRHADRLHHTRNGYVEINQYDEEDDGIAVDDATPLTISTILFQVVQRLPDLRFSFNLKLAFMFFFLYPFFTYVQLGLTLTINKRHIDEASRKNLGSVLSVSHFYYTYRVLTTFTASFTFLVLFPVLLLRPKDLLLSKKFKQRLSRQVGFDCLYFMSHLRTDSQLLDVEPSLVGDEICFRLNILKCEIYHRVSIFTNGFLRSLNTLFSVFMCSENMTNRQFSRMTSAFCVSWAIVSFFPILFLAISVGVVLIFLFLVTQVCLILGCSPFYAFFNTLHNRLIEEFAVFNWVVKVLSVVLLTAYSFLLFGCTIILLTSSYTFVISTVAYTSIGIVLNADNVTPYAASVLVVTTNIYFCYANFQNRYKEVKGMISTGLWELHKDTESFYSNDTIPTKLYWFVCGRVLPFKSEICRMLRNMALILIFLSLVVYSIAFYGSENDVSAIFSVIAVVLTGVVPALLLRLLTEGKSFKGMEKVNLKRKIHSAVEQFYQESRDENTIISDSVNKQSTDVEQV